MTAAAAVFGLCMLWLFLHEQSILAGSSGTPLQHKGQTAGGVRLRRLAAVQLADAAPARSRTAMHRTRTSTAANRTRSGVRVPHAQPGAEPLQGVAGTQAPQGQPGAAGPHGAAADVGADEFLAACGFSTADLPGEGVPWHTASSACAVLGRLDRLVLVGDSLTRQARPAPRTCPEAPHHGMLCSWRALLSLCMRGRPAGLGAQLLSNPHSCTENSISCCMLR